MQPLRQDGHRHSIYSWGLQCELQGDAFVLAGALHELREVERRVSSRFSAIMKSRKTRLSWSTYALDGPPVQKNTEEECLHHPNMYMWPIEPIESKHGCLGTSVGCTTQ